MKTTTRLFWRYLALATLGTGGVYYGFKALPAGVPPSPAGKLWVGLTLAGGTALLSLGTLALGRMFYLIDRRDRP